jgi:signal transduction histidine kinase
MMDTARAASVSPDELARLIGAFNDVTARLQESHEALRGEVARLTRELSEANAQVARSQRLAALGEMAAGIAHEVRNPMGSIRLYARMLEQDLADRPDQRRLAERIGGAVRTVDAIVGDVLTFAREFKVRPCPVEARALIDEVVESCMADAPALRGRVALRLEVPGSASSMCADPGLIRQALVNVVRNALDAMADTGGGELAIGMREAAVPADGGTPEEALDVLWVRDTGPGITPDVIARMFNPFFTTRGTGTGLGLPIVHRIMDAHGGRVGVRNNDPGPGACVELFLPRQGEHAHAPITAGAQSRPAAETTA